MKRSWRYPLALVIAFVVQAGLVGWLIGDRALLLANGREVRLAVVPVDPRDLLRGDYVVLSYDISRLDSSALDGDDNFEWGDPIYVSLTEGDNGWRATALSATPPTQGTWIRGQVTDSRPKSGDCILVCTIYSADYNIEKFFVPEGTGRELEGLRNDQHLSVDVALGAGGRAALKRLLVDGTPRYEEGPL